MKEYFAGQGVVGTVTRIPVSYFGLFILIPIKKTGKIFKDFLY